MQTQRERIKGDGTTTPPPRLTLPNHITSHHASRTTKPSTTKPPPPLYHYHNTTTTTRPTPPPPIPPQQLHHHTVHKMLRVRGAGTWKVAGVCAFAQPRVCACARTCVCVCMCVCVCVCRGGGGGHLLHFSRPQFDNFSSFFLHQMRLEGVKGGVRTMAAARLKRRPRPGQIAPIVPSQCDTFFFSTQKATAMAAILSAVSVFPLRPGDLDTNTIIEACFFLSAFTEESL